LALSIQGGDCNILICDETCDSLSPAVLAALLLVRYQVLPPEPVFADASDAAELAN
jgi:hypothetical protein